MSQRHHHKWRQRGTIIIEERVPDRGARDLTRTLEIVLLAQLLGGGLGGFGGVNPLLALLLLRDGTTANVLTLLLLSGLAGVGGIGGLGGLGGLGGIGGLGVPAVNPALLAAARAGALGVPTGAFGIPGVVGI